MMKTSLIVLVLTFFLPSFAHAQGDNRNVAARIDRLATQLTQLVSQQEQLEQGQDGLIKEIENLKIWSHKR